MKRWRIITLSVVATVVAAIIAFFALRNREPIYQGYRLKFWVEKLENSPDEEVWQPRAEEALRAMGSQAVPHLVKLLQVRRSPIKEAYSAIRRQLPWGLDDHLPNPRSADEIRALTLQAIKTLGPQASGAIPALTKMLGDRDTEWAFIAADALGKVGPDGVAVLVRRLKDKDVVRRRIVASSLIYSSLTSNEIIQPLVDSLKDQDCLVRLHSAQALLRIDPENEESVPALLALLRDKDNEFKEATISAFWDVAPKATAAVPTLISMLESESADEPFRYDCAVEILGRIGPAAKDAVPVLIKRLRKDTRWYPSRKSAAEALGRIGPAAKPASADLRSLMNDTNQVFELRVAPAIALWRIARDTNAALPLVVQSLQAKSRSPVFGFKLEEEVAILGDVGPAAKDAVPCLIKLLSAWHPSIRASAAEALRKIDPAAAAKALNQAPSSRN